MTSTNLPDHHYQMAADYTTNNAVYCDSNNPTATIRFASPTNYSAVSFLSANANGGIQVQVILDHDGAPSETNVFNSKDWFNGVPAAFTADGRCSSDNRSANNWAPGANNPRLYEAQFALADTVHNVTGATVIWTTNNGAGGVSGANSRFVVLAVSGTVGATLPVISSVVPSSFAGFEGTNFALTASAGGNPAPTYQWQAGTTGGGVFTNLSDGGVFSGTTTATLSFSGAVWQNSADYQLVAANAVGAVTSSVVTVRILSALPNVVNAGDPLSTFGGASPNGQDVTRAFDRIVGTNKYLNFGVNNGAPFAGPAGLIVTPGVGSTIISAMRIYTPNDHEERDPADYVLEGSNDGGTTWTQISSGALALPSTRSTTAALNALTEPLQEIHFANSAGYTSYRWTVNNVKTNSSANSMQVGEIELLGVLNPQPPYFVVQPAASVTNFAGGSPVLSALAAGAPPITYQWRRDGGNISGATTASFTITNVQLADSGHTYVCVANNQYGATPSTATVVTVIAAPTNAYPTSVIADHPIALWRLGEQPDNGAGNNGTVAYDHMGAHNGVYSNTTIAVAGYNAVDSDSAATFSGATASYVGGIGGIDFSAPNGTAVGLSVEAWVLSGVAGNGAQAGDDGIITKGYGAAEQFNLDTGGNNPAHDFRFFVRDAGGATHGAVSTNAPDNNWHHVVGVCDEVGGTVKIYVDGHQNGTTAAIGAVGLFSTSIPVSIGARRQSATTDYNLAFNGTLDEVAIYNYALTPAQVANHYLSTQPPARLVIQVVDPATLSVTWPAINGFVLQSTVDLGLGAAGWQDVAGAGAGQATVPITNTPQFFRLIYR